MTFPWACILILLTLAGCDPQRAGQLEEGVSTEADVRARFGAPDTIGRGPGGERMLEYERQPAGHPNYTISIGADGRMTALRPVPNPANFARIHRGMLMEDVHRLLGKPMTVTPNPPEGELAWDWRYLQPPHTPMVFTVWFGPDDHVLRFGSAPDLQARESR
jgi:hypothetical protein